jgi:uroporphyrinogen-III decarboxylase
MTDRERILAAVRGDPVDRIPWAPRLEFWYRGRKRKGTLPAELEGLTLPEVTDRLGVAHYAVVPDFTDCPEDPPMADRALGVMVPTVAPFRVSFEGVERRVKQDGPRLSVEYETPFGTVRTESVYTEESLDAGASVPWVTRNPIQGPEDFDAVAYVYEHLRVTPCLDGYLRDRERIGDRGIVVAFTSGTACPMHHIMKDLMEVEKFFYARVDYPDKIARLAEAVQPFFDGIQAAAAASPAEVVHLGGNYDDAITYPAFFAQDILPALKKYGDELHAIGKYLLTHTDGENRRLFPLYLQAGFDVADSVCPAPMTRCTFDEIVEAFQGKVTIWGGIPSVLLCSDSASWEDFRGFIDGLLARYGHSSRLILGVSDMVTVDCEWDRLQYITEQVARLA